MSRTELYIVKKGGNLEFYKGFGNSHRGASLLWHNLAKKYLSISNYHILFSNKEDEKLWRLDQEPSVPIELRIIHISTFDRMMIKIENLHRFIDAIKKVLNAKYFEDMGHFDIYPEVLEEIEKKQDIIAIAWNQTSINSGYWEMYEKCPTCGEHTITRDYNIFKDKKHQFLFEYLEYMKKKECESET